jgi:NitT/TauT family transport system substrate-binding protein
VAQHRDGGRWRLAAVALALTLVLAACGDGDGGSEAGGGSDGEPEVSELTLGTLPLVDVAPIHIAIADGLFEREGLTVELELMEGGAAAIPGLVSGELDVAFGAWPSFFQAITQGIELRAVADGVRAQPDFTAIMAAAGSDLEGNPAGLEGKTAALNTLNNLCELDVRSIVREAGGDDDAVKLVELPFPEMIPALERGDVDAVCVVEPFVTLAKRDINAVVIQDPYTGAMENFPVAGYQTTAQFAEQNPNTVAAFQRAISEGARIARDNPDRVREVVPTYTELQPDVAGELTLPEYVAELDPAQLQRVADYLVEFRILEQELQAEEYVVAPPG